MSEPTVPNERESDPVALRALLYAAGELEEAEVAAFEKRLGEDQAAREALCQAMALVLPGAGYTLAGPDPAYRAAVRQRLLHCCGLWPRLLQRRLYRGHPALWSVVGAAAVLLVFAIAPLPARLPAERGLPSPDASRQVVRPALREDPATPTTEAATLWANLPNSERLAQVRDEEIRRKVRSQNLPGRPALTGRARGFR